jgi:hypothetical protein
MVDGNNVTCPVVELASERYNASIKIYKWFYAQATFISLL